MSFDKGPFLNRQRAARLLDAAGLDALVIAEPEGFLYATGAGQGVAALFRRAGAGFALIPANPSVAAAAIVTDAAEAAFRATSPISDVRTHPAWIETADLRSQLADDLPIETMVRAAWAGRPSGFARPATFDLAAAVAALRDQLDARHLRRARLGFDLDYIAASDLTVIAAGLDGARIGDGSSVLDRLRMVKTPAEIERLRYGAELGEAGVAALAAGARAGQGVTELRDLFRAGVSAEAARRGAAAPDTTFEYIAVGPRPWQPGPVAPGAVIKVDVVCAVDGYMSDTSRNFVCGAATSRQRALHRALEDAFDAGAALIRPGTALRAVHAAATASLHAAGFVGYSRGHFGHGLGHALFSEQWPFIAADATVAFEPDMMMAFEIPLYLDGVGAFNLEDQVLLTADGHTPINRLARGLVEIG
jgi:Xaa-Pro aminopeptidase